MDNTIILEKLTNINVNVEKTDKKVDKVIEQQFAQAVSIERLENVIGSNKLNNNMGISAVVQNHEERIGELEIYKSSNDAMQSQRDKSNKWSVTLIVAIATIIQTIISAFLFKK